MVKDEKDVVYVVASKLGTIGMGSTSLNAVKGIERAGMNYKCFCRGYTAKVSLKRENLTNYSFLEYLSYPFRFVEKFFKIKMNSFKLVNYLFGELVSLNLPKTKIYHSWIGIAPKAIKKAKNQGAVLVLEAANSHPRNALEILEKEYKLFNVNMGIDEKKMFEEQERFVQNFDYVSCPSQFVYDSFLKRGFSKKKLCLIPYGVDIKRFRPSEKKENGGKIKFIFVGSIQLRKGIQYLLKAWDELKPKNAELIIVGRVWPDAYNVVKKYEKNSTIKFAGFDSDPVKTLQSADVFISPSLEEGSALTCYEALACGLPLIATHNTGSVMKDGKEGFIISIRDVEAIKKKIIYFCRNPEQVRKMGKAARKLAEDYTWDNYGDRLASFHKKILGDKNEK